MSITPILPPMSPPESPFANRAGQTVFTSGASSAATAPPLMRQATLTRHVSIVLERSASRTHSQLLLQQGGSWLRMQNELASGLSPVAAGASFLSSSHDRLVGVSEMPAVTPPEPTLSPRGRRSSAGGSKGGGAKGGSKMSPLAIEALVRRKQDLAGVSADWDLTSPVAHERRISYDPRTSQNMGAKMLALTADGGTDAMQVRESM